MPSLDEMLSRPGLPPRERLLIVAKAAIWPGDWDELMSCAKTARNHDWCRSELEETLLQAVLFFGFPRVVTAFEVVQREWPPDHPPSGGTLPADQQAAAGSNLFRAIYGKNTDSVRGMLRGFHAEFEDFVMNAAYGRILTRPALQPRLRELLAVGALAAMDQVPQLVAHGRGAASFGATRTEIEEAVFSATKDSDLAAQLTRKIVG